MSEEAERRLKQIAERKVERDKVQADEQAADARRREAKAKQTELLKKEWLRALESLDVAVQLVNSQLQSGPAGGKLALTLERGSSSQETLLIAPSVGVTEDGNATVHTLTASLASSGQAKFVQRPLPDRKPVELRAAEMDATTCYRILVDFLDDAAG